MNRDAANFQAIHAAREDHNARCPFGGSASRVHLAPFDIERLGWDEGDTIAGLVVEADPDVQPGRFRISCDAETGGGLEHVEESSRDLVPA